MGVLLLLWALLLGWYTLNTADKVVSGYARDAIAHQAQDITHFRNFYSAEIVKRAMEAGVTITDNYKDVPHALPLPATFVIDFGQYMRTVKMARNCLCTASCLFRVAWPSANWTIFKKRLWRI